MNNPSPNLTNVYVATPPVGPTPELLEYAPPPGCIGLTHGYPHTITGGVPHAGALKSPPLTHPCLPGHTHRCIPSLVGGNHAGSFKKNHKCKIEGNPLKNISQGLERPKPPTHTPWHRGGGVRGSEWETTGPNNFSQVENRGESLEKCWSPCAVHPLASRWVPVCRDSLQIPPAPHGLEQRGGPLEHFGMQP